MSAVDVVEPVALLLKRLSCVQDLLSSATLNQTWQFISQKFCPQMLDLTVSHMGGNIGAMGSVDT